MTDSSMRQAVEQGGQNVFLALQDVVLNGQRTVESAPASDWLEAELKVEGDYCGNLKICASDALCRKLISALFAGVDASRDLEEDALCECLNMVTESTRTLLTQEGREMNVQAPGFVGRGPKRKDPPHGSVELSALGEPVLLWFEAEQED